MSEADVKLTPAQEMALLERYAPVLRFSAEERFFPTRVEDYVRSCDALLVFDPQKREWLKCTTEKVLNGMDDPNSHLRFVERHNGPGSRKEPTLKSALITWGPLALYALLGCVALWWLFDLSELVGRLVSAVLVFLLVWVLRRVTVRVFEIIWQDKRSFAIAVPYFFIFAVSNFILLRLLTDLSVIRSLLIALIAALPLGIFYYALITESAGAVVQLKSGRTLAWADEACRKYRKRIVDSSEHVCTYYGRVVPVGQEWTVLQYFYFYAFNDWRSYGGMNLHEGDWESVMVYLPGNPPQDGTEPFGVAYSQHHGKEFLLWKNTQHLVKQVKHDEFHPVVYVALGSHANYPFADSRIEPSEMERFGLLQNTVSKLELQVRRIGLFGGRLPADKADGLGRHLIPAGDDAVQLLEHYLAKLDKLEAHTPGMERAPYLAGKLELITRDPPGWVHYTGLWGDLTDVPDESGPSGPKWEKPAHGKVKERTSWQDPLGWLEERKADAFESKAFEDLKDIVTHMWELEEPPPLEPLIECVRWVTPPGQTQNPQAFFDAFLDQGDESLLIFGESRDLNRTILHRLAQLQMQRVQECKSRRIPVILPLSSSQLRDSAGADNTARTETQQGVARDERVVLLMKRIAAELSALYGLPALVFYQWIDKQEFGETEGDETGVLLFIELDAQGPTDEWVEPFRSFAAHSQVIVSLDGKDDLKLGCSYTVQAQALKKERVAAALGIDRDAGLAGLDSLSTTDLKLLQELPPEILRSIESRQDLCQTYLEHKLTEISEGQPERLKNWLLWLAGQMQAHGQRLYQVDRMQPSWLERRYRRLYYFFEWLIPFPIVCSLAWLIIWASAPIIFGSSGVADYPAFWKVFGLLFGVATAITVWLAAHRRFGIVWAMICGAAFLVVVACSGYALLSFFNTNMTLVMPVAILLGIAVCLVYLFYGQVYGAGQYRYHVRAAWDAIDIFEGRDFSARRALQGAASGVLFGFVIWVLVGGFQSLPDILKDEPAALRQFANLPPRAVAFAVGTVLGMGFFLLWGFGKAHGEPNRDRSISPDRRISSACKNALVSGAVGAIFMGAPYILGAAILLKGVHHTRYFSAFTTFAVLLGLWAGVFVGLVCGGLTVFQHYALRLVIRLRRRDRRNLHTRLNEAAKLKLLVKRGRLEKDRHGTPVKRSDAYEFVSSGLLDHLAEQFTKG